MKPINTITATLALAPRIKRKSTPLGLRYHLAFGAVSIGFVVWAALGLTGVI